MSSRANVVDVEQPEEADGKKKPRVRLLGSATKFVDLEDSSWKKLNLDEPKHQAKVILAKSFMASFDQVLAFCGLMAGFLGFIINEYSGPARAGRSKNYSQTFSWGLFFLIMAFMMNVAAAIVSFYFGIYLRNGLFRQWFLWVVHAVKFVAGCGVLYFTIGILLLIETIKIDYNFKRIIYVIGGVMYASGMIASLCAMRQMHTTDPHVLLAYSEKLQE